MFARRRKKDDDYLGPSRGWARLMHRTVRFILFPLRKPLWFLSLVAIAFLAPTFFGVKPAEVHTWYWSKIKQSSSDVSAVVSSKTKDVMEKIPEIKLPEIQKKGEAGQPRVVNIPQKETRRKMFEKAKTKPVAIDILAKQKTVSQTAEPSAPASVSAASSQPQPTAKKKLALVYLEQPEKLSGNAIIVNANELIVDGKGLFLFGIYADPLSPRGVEAKRFLEQTVSGKTVDCEIPAYTYQSVPTGICKAGEISLNHALVDNGYSKNVALDTE